jgi:hypothetical protein
MTLFVATACLGFVIKIGAMQKKNGPKNLRKERRLNTLGEEKRNISM